MLLNWKILKKDKEKRREKIENFPFFGDKFRILGGGYALGAARIGGHGKENSEDLFFLEKKHALGQDV